MCELCAGKAVIRQAGEGEAVWFDGGLITITASAQDTGGAFATFEYIAPRGKATPLHRHPDADETFFLLEGTIKVHVDGVEHDGVDGATFVFRRDVPHAFAVTSERARLIMMLTPGGGENFFRAAGAPAERRDLPPPSERNLEQFQAAAAGNGVVLMGPPPFDMAAINGALTG
jgi:quercetin dioxygenase-like cupin family protein